MKPSFKFYFFLHIKRINGSVSPVEDVSFKAEVAASTLPDRRLHAV